MYYAKQKNGKRIPFTTKKYIIENEFVKIKTQQKR